MLLRLVDVSKRFGARWALSRVSLELDRPGVVLITGENGAGKTTLLKIIATAQRPTSGEVELFGLSAAANLDQVRARIGVITHQAHLYFELTPVENLELTARLAGKSTSAVRDIIARVGLAESAERPVGGFSAGMKRRVALARLLLLKPDLALLDEPFTQLDTDGVQLMENVVRELDAAGCLVLLSTHDIDRGLALADAHLTLENGRALSLTEVGA